MLVLAAAPAAAQLHSIAVDAGRTVAAIRPLSGVNDGPAPMLPGTADVTQGYRELRIDLIRTHDYFGPTDVDAKWPDPDGISQIGAGRRPQEHLPQVSCSRRWPAPQGPRPGAQGGRPGDRLRRGGGAVPRRLFGLLHRAPGAAGLLLVAPLRVPRRRSARFHADRPADPRRWTPRVFPTWRATSANGAWAPRRSRSCRPRWRRRRSSRRP